MLVDIVSRFERGSTALKLSVALILFTATRHKVHCSLYLMLFVCDIKRMHSLRLVFGCTYTSFLESYKTLTWQETF